MNNDYCPFCACYVDEELDYDDLMNYPLTIGSGHYAVDFGKFDIWIGRNGELSAGFHTKGSDYIDIMRKKINFCPICGKHLVEKGAVKHE